MKTLLKTILTRTAVGTLILVTCYVGSMLASLPLELLRIENVPILAGLGPTLVKHHAINAAAAVHGFADARGVGRRCDPGISWDTRRSHMPMNSERAGVTQARDGKFVRCRWPSKVLRCGNGMSDYEAARWSHYVAFADWAPYPHAGPRRDMASPHDFLTAHAELGIDREARVAVLVHLFVTRDRAWNADLYQASDEELLWWIGAATGMWWEAVDEDTLVIGRIGRDDYVIWDAETNRVYN